MEDNFIQTYEGVIDSSSCNAIIEQFENSIEAGACVIRNDKFKKDSQLPIDPVSRQLNIDQTSLAEFVYKAIAEGINNYVDRYNVHEIFVENVKPRDILIQRTVADDFESFGSWHCESFCPNTAQRVLAWTIYLNDNFDGGGTEFKFQKHIEPAKSGKLVIWPAAFTHTHRGSMLLSGKKYIITGWLYY